VVVPPNRYNCTKPWSTLKTTLKSGVITVPCGCTPATGRTMRIPVR